MVLFGMAKKALVFLAAGFEEVEAVTPIDYLRRAEIEVITVSITDELAVRGSHGIQIIADKTIQEISGAGEYDALIIPGGSAGAANLASSSELTALLKAAVERNKLLCAICAAPVMVLAEKGFLKDHLFTCYPGTEEKIDFLGSASGAKWAQERVVIDKNLITSRAAGTAGAFSLAIIERLTGKESANRIAASVLLS